MLRNDLISWANNYLTYVNYTISITDAKDKEAAAEYVKLSQAKVILLQIKAIQNLEGEALTNVMSLLDNLQKLKLSFDPKILAILGLVEEPISPRKMGIQLLRKRKLKLRHRKRVGEYEKSAAQNSDDKLSPSQLEAFKNLQNKTNEYFEHLEDEFIDLLPSWSDLSEEAKDNFANDMRNFPTESKEYIELEKIRDRLYEQVAGGNGISLNVWGDEYLMPLMYKAVSCRAIYALWLNQELDDKVIRLYYNFQSITTKAEDGKETISSEEELFREKLKVAMKLKSLVKDFSYKNCAEYKTEIERKKDLLSRHRNFVKDVLCLIASILIPPIAIGRSLYSLCTYGTLNFFRTEGENLVSSASEDLVKLANKP